MQIDLALQPIVMPMTGRVTSYEVLARRIEPRSRRLIMPVELVRGSQGTSWQDVDLAVLRKLCESLDDVPPDVGLNINIAPETVVDADYWDHYCQLVDWLVRVRVAQIVIELSERIDLPECEVFHLIRSLRDLGAWVALDDLGAECSSRTRLEYHNWDICKIDYRPRTRLQVADFIDETIALCRHRKVLTVLEGVETAQDVLMARGMDVDRCQGYAYGRPFLRAQTPAPVLYGALEGTA